MSYLVIENLGKKFTISRNNEKTEVVVLEGLSFNVGKGEFVSIFGPNGCGKTTLLNIISGLIPYDSGKVTIEGNSPGKTKVGYVFQNYIDSLYPWLRSIDNIALPLELIGLDSNTRKTQVIDMVKKLQLDFPLNEYPYRLSGGQQQMVALARALINKPELLLLDEPFGALDYHMRMIMQTKIQEIHQLLSVTILFVSHDLEEALYLGDRIIFLSKKPTKVVEILENSMPRYRTPAILTSKEFSTLKDKALKIFNEVMSS